MTRRAVVSYPVDASDAEKRRELLLGIRECAAELLTLGHPVFDVSDELEQVANDCEAGELV
jgi:hypothetical protein